MSGIETRWLSPGIVPGHLFVGGVRLVQSQTVYMSPPRGTLLSRSERRLSRLKALFSKERTLIENGSRDWMSN